MKILRPSLLASLLAATLVAAAAPAPWFTWRSKLDGKQFCSQTSLGPGWEKAGGPYRDGQCKYPLKFISKHQAQQLKTAA